MKCPLCNDFLTEYKLAISTQYECRGPKVSNYHYVLKFKNSNILAYENINLIFEENGYSIYNDFTNNYCQIFIYINCKLLKEFIINDYYFNPWQENTLDAIKKIILLL